VSDQASGGHSRAVSGLVMQRPVMVLCPPVGVCACRAAAAAAVVLAASYIQEPGVAGDEAPCMTARYVALRLTHIYLFPPHPTPPHPPPPKPCLQVSW
jgi:hypothetical protein